MDRVVPARRLQLGDQGVVDDDVRQFHATLLMNTFVDVADLPRIPGGFQYARALASWSVKLGFDGFEFDVPEGHLGFAPKVNNAEFKTFWSTGVAWGNYAQNLKKKEFALTVSEGRFELSSFSASDLPEGTVKASVGGEQVAADVEQGEVVFAKPVVLNAGDTLTITIQ